MEKQYRYNFVVNVLDGGFFGFALGFASFVTVIPLFVSSMTDSAVLIGLIPAIHVVGWQLPQLLTAQRVSRLNRFKPVVLFLTIHERLPYLGLAFIAWFLPSLGIKLGLITTFILLIWQGFGGGFTATAWQSLIGKIIPSQRRGIFFGIQSSLGSLLASISAVLAGIILEKVNTPLDYTLCFIFASIAMAISWFFLAETKEEYSPIDRTNQHLHDFWAGIIKIMRIDINFRWFIFSRMLMQFTTMAFSFYTVYLVRLYGITESLAGIMTAVLLATQIVANPLMGFIGDRLGHRPVLEFGVIAAVISALIAWLSPGISWFYVGFAFAGITNVSAWTITMAMTLEFGTENERPAYIGLANTLIAPSTILAPLMGGWLADFFGYKYTFLSSVIAGVLTFILIHFAVKDPKLFHFHRQASESSVEKL